MSYKRPFDDVMREFNEKFPGEVEKLSAEEIAERTGYSVSTVQIYLRQQSDRQFAMKRIKEIEHIRAQESGAVTYVSSSGNARVVYYPLLGEAKIISNYRRKREFSDGYEREFSEWRRDWDGGASILLSPQDAIEIGIYLLGLQPHIRDVLSRKDNAVSQESRNIECPTPDMDDQDL